jgi:hypothetical protein
VDLSSECLQPSLYGTSMPGAGAVHHIRLGHFGDVGSMSGSPESGYDLQPAHELTSAAVP